MLQAGYEGLAYALKTYDISKNVPLKSWVYRIVNSQVIKCRYKNSKERREVSGYDNYFFETVEDDINTPLEDLINKEEDEVKTNKCETILALLTRVTAGNTLNKTLYIERILEGKRLTFLAKKYELSYSTISHRVAKVTSQIKEELQKL